MECVRRVWGLAGWPGKGSSLRRWPLSRDRNGTWSQPVTQGEASASSAGKRPGGVWPVGCVQGEEVEGSGQGPQRGEHKPRTEAGELWDAEVGAPLMAPGEGGELCLWLLAWQYWAPEGRHSGSRALAGGLAPSVSAHIGDAGPEDPPLGPSRKRAECPSPPELLVGI